MDYKLLIKMSFYGAKTLAQSETLATRDKSASKSKIIPNQQLAEKSHKPIIRKFEKRKRHSSFKDHIQGPDLEDMQLIKKCNKGFQFLTCSMCHILSKFS